MATTTIDLELPKLRRDQWRLYDAMQRFNCWVCHRRFGKTVLALEVLVAKAAACTLLDPRFAYFAPQRAQAKDIAWLYLSRFTEDIPGVDINQSELRVTLPHNAAQIRLYGADNYRLGRGRRGIYLDGVVVDEYADIAPVIWTQVLRPMLTDRKGWAIFIGTPRGKNHFYQLYRQADERSYWSADLLKASDTGVIDADELAMIYQEAVQDGKLADYEQEYQCSWDAPMPGAVYAEQLRRMDTEGRVGQMAYTPSLPVGTMWDIGPLHTAIWFFQLHSDRICFIDYYEGAGDLAKHISVVKARPYIYDHAKVIPPRTRSPYEQHFGPHDLEDSPDYATPKTRMGVAMEEDFRFTVIPRGQVEDGIEATRRMLAVAWFDEKRCEEGLNALRSYRYEYDEEKQTFRTIPVHDWASHGADSLRTGAVGLYPQRPTLKEKPHPRSFNERRKVAIGHKRGKNMQGRSFKVFS